MNRQTLPQTYQDLLQEYVRLMQLLQQAYDDERITTLDQQKYELHREIETIAREHGYDISDVHMHILQAEGNLSEYDLPEIAIRDLDILDFDSKTVMALQKKGALGKMFPLEDSETKGKVLLLFGTDLGSAYGGSVFLEDEFFFRTPIGEERKKRIDTLIEETQLGDYIEMDLFETFHAGDRIYGYLIEKRHLPTICTFIRAHRQEISPDVQFLDEETLLQRWNQIFKEDMAYICAYRNEEEPKTIPQLIEQYKRIHLEALQRESLPQKKLEQITDILEKKYREGIRMAKYDEQERRLPEDDFYQDIYGEKSPKGSRRRKR